MALGRKTGGRKKGTPNKTTVAAKEAISLAAERLGGVDRLVAWAESDDGNERLFWSSIYPKLLPHQITGADGGPIRIAHAEEMTDDELAAVIKGTGGD